MRLIETTEGLVEESRLERRESVIDDDNEQTVAVEYYLGDKLVHRSVTVQLKKWPDGLGALLSDAMKGPTDG